MKNNDDLIKKIGKQLTVPEQSMLAAMIATAEVFDLTFGEMIEAIANAVIFIIDEINERVEGEAHEISEMLKQAEEVLKDA